MLAALVAFCAIVGVAKVARLLRVVAEWAPTIVMSSLLAILMLVVSFGLALLRIPGLIVSGYEWLVQRLQSTVRSRGERAARALSRRSRRRWSRYYK